MSEGSLLRPAPTPLRGPTDTMELIGRCRCKGRNSDRLEWIYVVVHRSHGLWTHIYVAVQSPGCWRTEIRLVRVMAGDRLGEARAWALATRGNDLIRPAHVEDMGSYGRAVAVKNTALRSLLQDGGAFRIRRRDLQPAPMPAESAFMRSASLGAVRIARIRAERHRS